MQTRYLNKFQSQTINKNHTPEPQPIDRLLMRNRLGYLIKKAKRLITLDKLVKECLPAELQPLCRVVNCVGPNLILGVSCNAAASKIRFMSTDILQELQLKCKQFDHGATVPISALRIKVKLNQHHAPTNFS